MPLWLHPVHVQADGHCSPLKLSGDERSRGDKINSTLLQVAQAQDGLKAGVFFFKCIKTWPFAPLPKENESSFKI